MKTSTVEIGGLISTLSAAGVQRQLSTLPGVHHADVNYVAGSASVHYDEAQVSLQAICQRVIDCGYHCRGELVPAHVCAPADHKAGAGAHAGHAGHSANSAHPGHPGPAAHADPAHPASHGNHGSAAKAGGTPQAPMADMMHDMGHAPGMSMQDMAVDMRNRFLVALVFAVPVLLYSPMG